MKARADLQKLLGEYSALTGRTQTEAASNLLLAHCVLLLEESISGCVEILRGVVDDAKAKELPAKVPESGPRPDF